MIRQQGYCMSMTGIPAIPAEYDNLCRHATHLAGEIQLTLMVMSFTGSGTDQLGDNLGESDSPLTEDKLGATIPTDSPSTSPCGTRGATNQLTHATSLRP